MEITDKVKEDAAWVATQTKAVKINDKALAKFARSFLKVPVPTWDADIHFDDGGVKTVMYLLVLDAINFCFWPSEFTVTIDGVVYGEEDGYPALAAALTRAFEEGVPMWDPTYLAKMPFEEFEDVFRGQGKLALLEERHRNVMDVGATLKLHFKGDVTNLLAEAKGSAPKLVADIAATFASYADERSYAQRNISILKRAQLFVSDVSGAFGNKKFGKFTGLEELTCFADYKLPQLLRSEGVFVYDDALDKTIGEYRELPADSVEEVEIRCMTIHAVEQIKEALSKMGRSLTSRELDWMMWNRSVEPGAIEGEFHRTLTTSY